MNFKQFKEEMSPASCKNFDFFFIARIGDAVIRYDVKGDYFDIMKRPRILILDGTGLRTAKAFIKLEKDNE